eukprot:m51a1_g9969 putative glucose-6-phosphate 1-dehydrogenase (561) ;mRNA; r:94911-96943
MKSTQVHLHAPHPSGPPRPVHPSVAQSQSQCEDSPPCARAINENIGRFDSPRAVHSPSPATLTAAAPGAEDDVYTVVVLGASGDLAKRKIFPALLRLRNNKWLPPRLCVVGFSRTHMSEDEFRARVCSEKDPDPLTFKNHYVVGDPQSPEDVQKLSQALRGLETEAGAREGARKVHRLFYMALPPSVFVGAAQTLRQHACDCSGWSRIVVEKPFGSDLESSREMMTSIGALFSEDQIYRIDHYLAKEMVQNLNVLRFANVFLRPLWSREYISNVVVTFKDEEGVAGRAGYFDHYGIIRDIMQNHLLQILTLVAMETPVSLSAEDIRDEKVKVLRCVAPVSAEDVVVGQYEGYHDEPGVAKDSLTPTFAAARLFINNTRWSGVPFILRCGKGLNERKAEIRVQFREPGNFLYRDSLPNELVIRLQPNEAIYLKMMCKAPGMLSELVETELDMTIQRRFADASGLMPDAYEFLVRDVIRGDHSLFVRSDELDIAWRIFTPLLKSLEATGRKPQVYPRGSRGPHEGDVLLMNSGFKTSNGNYQWPLVRTPGVTPGVTPTPSAK